MSLKFGGSMYVHFPYVCACGCAVVCMTLSLWVHADMLVCGDWSHALSFDGIVNNLGHVTNSVLHECRVSM